MWGNGCPRAFQALRCRFESDHSLHLVLSVVSMQHAGLLTREVVVRVHPEGPTFPFVREHPDGDIVEGKDAALSARQYGFESRCPRQDAPLRREGTATLEVS
jgi:hypothetical protein